MNEEPTLRQFFEAWELFGTPALAGAVAGLLLGAIGVYVVLRHLVFLSAALSQAAGLGVALSFYVGARVPSLDGHTTASFGAAVFTALAALPFFARTKSHRRDGWLGLTWLAGAAGALAVGSRIVESEDVHSLLFGTAVVVLPDQFRTLLVLAVLVLALHAWWVRGFVFASIDPDGARTRGVPVRVLDLALLATLTLSISIATRILGALPVFAFTILPGMAALRLVRTVPRGIVLAAALGGASGFLGYLLAFRLSLPVGASQALVAILFVALAELVHRRRGR
jgi:zinc transport system permease protein